MKFISWNVNGLRAVAGKGFADIFTELEADIVCLQETKLQAGQLDLEFLGYESYWNYAQKKGYSGTAVYTKEGRVITLEYEKFFLVCVYVPNSQDGLKRLDYRMQWEDAFREYLKALPKPVIMCGDLNVAHEEIDLKNPSTNHFNAGFSDEERGKFTELLAAGFVDSWRFQHPGEAKYSWWSYRMNARERNVGWRIDYFVVSESLKDAIVSTEIHNEIFGSDHCPVELVTSF